MGEINAEELRDYKTMGCVECGMLNVVHRGFLDQCRCAYCGGALRPVKGVVLQEESTIHIGLHFTVTEE